jgi:nitrate/nitrite transporter NarK
MALTAIPNLPDVLALTFLTLAGAAAFAWIPGFWMLPTLSLSRDAAAASIGFINAVGNLGGFFGPYITGLLRSHAPPRMASAIVVVAAYLISAAITWRVPVPRDSQQTRKL